MQSLLYIKNEFINELFKLFSRSSKKKKEGYPPHFKLLKKKDRRKHNDIIAEFKNHLQCIYIDMKLI